MEYPAEIALDVGVGEFGCAGHRGSPLVYEKVLKYSKKEC
jgi:hypothetical protein